MKLRSAANEGICLVVLGWSLVSPRGGWEFRGTVKGGRVSLDSWVGKRSLFVDLERESWKSNATFRSLLSADGSAGWLLRPAVPALGSSSLNCIAIARSLPCTLETLTIEPCAMSLELPPLVRFSVFFAFFLSLWGVEQLGLCCVFHPLC